MEFESGVLAKTEIASLVNSRFVPLLLDSNEAPQVALAYKQFARASRGGSIEYPIDIVAAPDMAPLVAVTGAGAADFKAALTDAADRWASDKVALRVPAAQILVSLVLAKPPAAPEIAFRAGDFVVQSLSGESEKSFARTPQQLQAPLLGFLARRAAARDDEARRIAVDVVRAIGRGGIHDHVGGGFFHEALDAEWRVPVFEKRLADQALMAMALTDLWQVTRDDNHARMARRTLDAMLRELGAPGGGFYSGLGGPSLVAIGSPILVYGRYYTWSYDEVRRILGPRFDLVAACFGLKREGNVPTTVDAHADLKGLNIFYAAADDEAIRKRFSLKHEADLQLALGTALDKLQSVRGHRPPPVRDDDVITAWNSLAASALARAAVAFNDEQYATAAARTAQFIDRTLYDAKGRRLLRDADTVALPEDYAFAVQAFLDVYEATLQPRWLLRAVQLQQEQDERFWSPAALRYDITSALPPQLRDQVDDRDRQEPSANGVAASNLVRFAALTGAASFSAKSESIVRSFAATLQSSPLELASIAEADDDRRRPAKLVIVAGDLRLDDAKALIATARSGGPLRPLLIAFGTPSDRAQLATVVPAVQAIPLPPPNGPRQPAAAYVCVGGSCSSAIVDPAVLAAKQ